MANIASISDAIAAPANIFLCDLLVGKLTKDEQQISLEISGIGSQSMRMNECSHFLQWIQIQQLRELFPAARRVSKFSL